MHGTVVYIIFTNFMWRFIGPVQPTSAKVCGSVGPEAWGYAPYSLCDKASWDLLCDLSERTGSGTAHQLKVLSNGQIDL